MKTYNSPVEASFARLGLLNEEAKPIDPKTIKLGNIVSYTDVDGKKVDGLVLSEPEDGEFRTDTDGMIPVEDVISVKKYKFLPIATSWYMNRNESTSKVEYSPIDAYRTLEIVKNHVIKNNLTA